jgi:hypothetical protein
MARFQARPVVRVITGRTNRTSLTSVSLRIPAIDMGTCADGVSADKFFKYNDEQVTEVPASEVLEDRTGSDANPALLCYVRRGMDLVDVLHREVLELERARIQDEMLEDGMKDGTGAGRSAEVPPATLHSVETLETDDDKQLIELD